MQGVWAKKQVRDLWSLVWNTLLLREALQSPASGAGGLSKEQRALVVQRMAAIKAKLAMTPICKEPSRFQTLIPRCLFHNII